MIFTTIEIALLSEEAVNVYKKGKNKMDPMVVTECVEKYLMTNLFPCAFPPSQEFVVSFHDATLGLRYYQLDQKIYHKISKLQQFLETDHLDIPRVYKNEQLWGIAQQGTSTSSITHDDRAP